MCIDASLFICTDFTVRSSKLDQDLPRSLRGLENRKICIQLKIGLGGAPRRRIRDSGPVLPLALLHLSPPLAVLLIGSRSVRRGACPGFPLSTPASHMSSSPPQDFFAAGCPTSLFDFAGSEHGLRDGNGIPPPDTRPRAPACPHVFRLTQFSQYTGTK